MGGNDAEGTFPSDGAPPSPDPGRLGPRRFGALRDRHSRPYLFTAALSMLGDNNEHVVTYWMLWQRFHSPALVGFQVVSHWLPFLLLSVPFGALAERLDCRRLIQAAQALFVLVSVSWGVLFLTGSLHLWEACLLLVLHGCAGCLWAPAEQLLLYDFARPQELAGAVRLNSTFRNLGTLCGPAVGSVLLFGIGPVAGIFFNALFYLPMTLLMFRTPYTGHTRSGYVNRSRMTFLDTFGVLRTVGRDRVLVSMISLSGLIGICVGGSLQAAMPSFAGPLGVGNGGFGYAVLLFANGAGGVLGGILLEAARLTRPDVKAAVITTILFGATTSIVALGRSYPLALVALVFGGVASLASQSIGQAVVQLRAPVEQRGRVVGTFNMFGQGLRTGNGIGLAALGSLVGVGPAVAVGGLLLAIGASVCAGLIVRPAAAAVEEPPSL